jgi:hypothetical protein
LKKLAQAPNAALAAMWADTLNAAGISVHVNRWHLSSIAGDIPPDQALPELWVVRDDDLQRAKDLLAELQNPVQRRWHCPHCAELVEGAFEQCWNCGTAMPTAP